MLLEAGATLLGGLGLFFVGITLVSANLKKMTSRRLRLFFSRFTDRDWRSALLGLVSGFATQSTAVSAFITAGLVSSGLMTVRRALPVAFWANAGCAILVLIAVLDIRYLVSVLIFLSGLSVAFERPRRFRHLALTIFGVGLLFLGLQMVREGALPLAQMQWVKDTLAAVSGHYVLALVMGAVLTVATQTSLGIAIISISLSQSGLIGPLETIMLMYGVHVGSAVITWLYAAGIKGSPRQLIMSQVLFNFVGTVIMVTLFYVEVLGGVPLVYAATTAMASEVAKQMALVIVLFNWVVPVLFFPLHGVIADFLARRWPETEEEELSRMRFLGDRAVESPDMAVHLAGLELGRLVARLPEYVGADKTDIATRHAAFTAVSGEVGSVLEELAARDLDHATAHDVVALRGLLEQVVSLERGVQGLVSILGEQAGAMSTQFYGVLRESLQFYLLSLADAWTDETGADAGQLDLLTRDGGENLEQFRKRYLAMASAATVAERSAMHQSGALFERVVWIMNRMAALLADRAGAELGNTQSQESAA